VIFVQYGNADTCEAKATAIAKATPANNVFMVYLPNFSFGGRGLPLTQSNAAQRGTHIRPRNRKRFDGAVAVVRSVAVTICAYSSSWRSLYSLRSTVQEPHRRFCDSHHVSEKLCGQEGIKVTILSFTPR